MKLRLKLAITNLIFKLIFVGLFLALLPYLSERINIYQTDEALIEKRENILNLISEVGVEPFIFADSINSFGSYNILKEEFISLEKTELYEPWNFIEITQRRVEGEVIDYRVLNYSFKVDGEMYLLEIGKSLTSISLAEKNIRSIILVFLVTFIILSFIFELVYTRTLLWPMDAIIKKIKNSSDPSSFNRKPIKTSTSDFSTLDTTLIDLMDKIQSLFQKEKEITENISHELLTPVSILRGKLENMLLRENVDEDIIIKTEEALNTLHRLKTLVNSLLLIARVESCQYIKEDSFTIASLINNIIEELSPMAEDAGIVLDRGDLSTDKTISGVNYSLLFTMFYNVVNNALKNTHHGGTVKISATGINKRLLVSISDNGKGITLDQMENIFMRFKKKKTVDDEGTGIGLAITKSIADFHNIQIKVDSSTGKGTRFDFYFPY